LNLKLKIMKKSLLLILILFLVISCLKQPEMDLTKEIKTLSSNDNANMLIRDPHIQDSLDKVFLTKYLDYTPLTQFELDSIAKNLKPTSSGKGVLYFDWPEYTDWSGWIHIKVRVNETSSPAHAQDLLVTLPDDWVLVGGGVEAIIPGSDLCTTNGAFISASYPDGNGWHGHSKDHAISYLHNIRVYAIGMKIAKDGFVYDPADLRSNDLPHASCTIPNGYQLIGGGGLDNYSGYGNMLIESYPNSFYPSPGSNWYVKGKAHKRSDPSPIRAYAIGIKDIQYPGVGYIRTGYTSLITYSSEGYCSPLWGPLYCDMPSISGYALTCPGGIVTYNGWGRMFQEIWPSSLGSNDCYYNDTGNNQAIGIGIEKNPTK
jgi:hypothetical protein